MHAYHFSQADHAADSREIFEVTARLAERLAATAAERDRNGGTPKVERALVRDSGFLGLAIPRELGGLEAPWSVTLRVVRQLARVDGSVAHVFGFHHLLLTTVRLFGSTAQFRSWASESVREHWFWGNAVNPLDKRTTLTWKDDVGIIRGDKSFCSGALDSDRLVVSALDTQTQKLLIGVVLITQLERLRLA
ncbi:MAG TPA: acyl-CoA dehydrogenase family protein [Polyangiales bacterium]|nr:acyl-CoA dehydrogenase family protein [Polyangiales bacterium]